VDDQQHGDRAFVDVDAQMVRLGWGVFELWSAAIGLGDVGTVADVREHLASGNHLSEAQHTVLVAALHDGLLDADASGDRS